MYVFYYLWLHLDIGGCCLAAVVSNSWGPMDHSPPGSSGHGILQARILEWVAIPFSRGSSRPRNHTQVSCTAGRFFTNWATREAQMDIFCYLWLHLDIVSLKLSLSIDAYKWNYVKKLSVLIFRKIKTYEIRPFILKIKF